MSKASLEGWSPELPDAMAKAEAIDRAFDYRGDVTLTLADGTVLECYVFNRNAKASPPFVQVYPKDDAAARTIPYDQVVGVRFSGRDPASGASWESWLRNYESRHAKAAAPEAAAEPPRA
ncbi:MAG: hypothetical protein HYZ53_10125 [Planctomycetes bacterium]|nr:hypothetical protein [Planctomycetota bacterium]